MNYKERTSHKKQAKSNTYWDAPAASGASDFQLYETSTYRDSPSERGIFNSHPCANKSDFDSQNIRKAYDLLPDANGTECEEQEKRRGRYYHPSTNNTYCDALDARGSRDSKPYSSNYEFRKSEIHMWMEEREHHVATGGMVPEVKFNKYFLKGTVNHDDEQKKCSKIPYFFTIIGLYWKDHDWYITLLKKSSYFQYIR